MMVFWCRGCGILLGKREEGGDGGGIMGVGKLVPFTMERKLEDMNRGFWCLVYLGNRSFVHIDGGLQMLCFYYPYIALFGAR